MNELFQWCVDLLVVWGNAIGMTYEEINIWIFVIIEPIVFFVMLIWIIKLKRDKSKMLTFIKPILKYSKV